MMGTKKQAIDALSQKESKYFDLVWFARKPDLSDDEYWGDTPNDIFLKAQEGIARVKNEHTAEVNALTGENGEWQHGFNSGMLAGMRYALELLQGDPELAEQEFPFLDT
jgi:hypothetical protein